MNKFFVMYVVTTFCFSFDLHAVSHRPNNQSKKPCHSSTERAAQLRQKQFKKKQKNKSAVKPVTISVPRNN